MLQPIRFNRQHSSESRWSQRLWFAGPFGLNRADPHENYGTAATMQLNLLAMLRRFIDVQSKAYGAHTRQDRHVSGNSSGDFKRPRRHQRHLQPLCIALDLHLSGGNGNERRQEGVVRSPWTAPSSDCCGGGRKNCWLGITFELSRSLRLSEHSREFG